jgi:hypothetical protein
MTGTGAGGAGGAGGSEGPELTSCEKLRVDKVPTPFAAVTVNPKTCLSTGKFPVPQVGFVHVTLVLVNVGVHARLLVFSGPVQSVDVGAPAPVTPVSPLSVIVAGLPWMLQLSIGANVRVYVHVGGPAETTVNVGTAPACHVKANRRAGSRSVPRNSLRCENLMFIEVLVLTGCTVQSIETWWEIIR